MERGAGRGDLGAAGKSGDGMTYGQIRAQWSGVDEIMLRVGLALDAGFGAAEMIAWADRQAARCGDPKVSEGVRQKVRQLVAVKTDKGAG